MPLSMFERRSIWTANLVMFLLSGSLFAMWFFVSLYLQEVRGYTPIGTGLAFIPQTLTIIFGAQLSSRLLLRLGPRVILVAGGLLAAVGLFWISGVGTATSYWSAFFVPSWLITLGLGLSFTPLAYAATAGVAPHEAGLASGLVNTSRQIGGAVGLAALATVATTRTRDLIASIGRLSAMTSGYTLAFRIESVIALAAAAAALLVPARSVAPVEVPGAVAPAASPATD